MAWITIPFGYTGTDRSVTPICVNDHDSETHNAWINRGVAPAHKWIVRHAGKFLRDRSMASDISQKAVDRVAKKFGDNLGENPHGVVARMARWCAMDMHRQKRSHAARELSIEPSIVDPTDYAQEFTDLATQQKYIEAIRSAMTDRELKMFNLYLAGLDWKEIAERMDMEPKRVWEAVINRARKAVAGMR